MDVLIKGMEMPKRGDAGRLTIQICSDGSVYVVKSCAIYLEDYSPKWTAKELPSHGRLIDADALTDDLKFDVGNDQRILSELKKDSPDEFTDIEIATTQDDKDIKQNCIELIKATRTIIEASE